MSHSLSKNFTFGSLIRFALPTTVMMVVLSLYTIVDGIFVSRFVGTNALSSINIVYPFINIILGLGIMISTGSSAIVARKMGEGKTTAARETFTATVCLNIGTGLAIAIFGNVFAVPVIRMLGASDILMADCITYLRWQVTFAPALMLQTLFQMYFVTEGRPGIGLFLTILAGVTNGVLDYILIVPLQLGIAGAAMATITGYLIPAGAGLLYFARARKSLWFVRPRFLKHEIGETCINGSSEMVTNLSAGIVTFLFNLLMMRYAGEDGVAAITIIQYSEFLLNALFMGFSQGVAPVISFNYGSNNHAQLKSVFRTTLIFIGTAAVTVFLFSFVAGAVIVGIFAKPGTAVFTLAREGFRIFAFSFLFSGLNIFSSSLFTALSDGKTSAFISFVRTLGLISISLLVLPALLGITGIWLAVPLAEAGAALMCILILKKYKTIYKYA